MNKYKKFIPIVAVILIALGVNLEKFGIDLNDFTGNLNSQTSQTSAPTPSNNSQSETAESGSSTSTNADPGAHWSNTSPKVNLWHIFEGEINRKGKPVGYHSRPNGQDPANARVTSVKSKPNRAGVYTANIEIRDQQQWKSKFSSFFPDSMSREEVIEAIVHAYKNSRDPNKQPWSGPSGLGFEIQGYTASRGDINTAFPIFVKNQ